MDDADKMFPRWENQEDRSHSKSFEYQADRSDRKQESKEHAAESSIRTVVLIEDDLDSNEMMTALLEIEGFEIASETNGRSGLSAILKLRPDTALIDIGLPQMNGYEVATAVRKELGPSIQLIAFTGHGRDSDIADAMNAGFNAHHVKPVDVDKLIAMISG